MPVRLTELEREIAGRVLRGEDPWGSRLYHGGGTRLVSQALGRLERKGVITDSNRKEGRRVTDLGRTLLMQDDPSFRPSHVGEVGFAGMVTYHCPKHGDVIACACKPA
jgi:hypothetical protein